MSSSLDLRLRYLPLRSIAGAALVNPALYYEIGDPLEAEVRLLKFDNLTNREVFISVNGVDAWTVLPKRGFFVVDITANKSQIDGLYANEGTQFWANAGVVPTTGSVYITALSSGRI